MAAAANQQLAGATPGAELVFTFDGPRGTIAPKLAAFLAGHKHMGERHVQRAWAIGLGGLAAAIALFLFAGPIFAGIAAVACLVGLFWSLGSVWELEEMLDRGGDVHHAFVELLDDIHPRARVRGRVDLSQVTDGESYRSRTSPYSGATKLDYRHRWFELRAPLVDGGCLALELTSLAKVKSNTTIRRELQLRGRYRLPAGAAIPEARGVAVVQAPEPRQQGPATVPTTDAPSVGTVKVCHVRREGGGIDVVFWGRLEDPDQLPGVLVGIGHSLGRARAKRGA